MISDGAQWLYLACIASWACLGIDVTNQVSHDDPIIVSMLNTMVCIIPQLIAFSFLEEDIAKLVILPRTLHTFFHINAQDFIL